MSQWVLHLCSNLLLCIHPQTLLLYVNLLFGLLLVSFTNIIFVSHLNVSKPHFLISNLITLVISFKQWVTEFYIH